MGASEGPIRQLIATLSPGQRIDDQIYRISRKDLRTTNNGGLYIHAILADQTGQILARMWNASQEIYDSMPEGGFLHFRGRVESYKGNRQFIIDGVRAPEPGEVRIADFLPSTDRDVEAMWSRVKEILRTIRNPHLLALTARFVHDQAFVDGFKRAPAAVEIHHAYVGGLLEHTLNLLELAAVVIPRYPQLSLDLVLAGIFLHDCGKIRELEYDTNFAYTTEGHLIGHIVTAVLWVHEKAAEIEAETGKSFPREVENALKHIILAHHGKYEFGSPRLPMMPEAVAVHYLDNLDAKIYQYLHQIQNDNDDSRDFTEYVRSLETKIWKTDVLGVRSAGSPPGQPRPPSPG